MRKNIFTKDTIAWIVLVFAVILFSAAVALAQIKNNPESGNGKIKILLSENKNGITWSLDTTLDASDDAALKKIMKDFGTDDEIEWKKGFFIYW